SRRSTGAVETSGLPPILNGWLLPDGLRIQTYEVEKVRRHVRADMQPEGLRRVERDRVIVGPRSFGEQSRELVDLRRGDLPRQQLANAFSDLHNGLLSLIGEDQRIVIDL